ncbi:MAG: TolC family protein [Nitrospiria bacterium]
MLAYLVAMPSPAKADPIMTLDDAYRSAILRHPAIKIVREALVQAGEEVRSARSALYPKVEGNLEYLRRPEEKKSDRFILRSESESQLSVTLSQPIYSGGRAMATYRSTKLGIKGEALNLVLIKEDLLFEVARAYYMALKAKNNVRIEAKEVERLKAHRRSAEKRFQVGEVTKTALLRAEAELSNARAKLIRARNDEAARKDELALLANIEGSFETAEPPSVSFPDRPRAYWMERSHENRLELKQEDVRIDQAKAGVAFARGSFLPSLSLELEYRWVDQDPKGDFLVENDTLGILKLRVPIFEGMLRKAQLAQARSRFRQAALERQKIMDKIDLAVSASFLDLSSLTAELEHLKDRVRFAREAFSLASRQFDVGLGTHIDVLDANATLQDAERRFSNTVYDREVAILSLQKHAGLFTPMNSRMLEKAP